MHPLLGLALSHPDLLGKHALAYGELISAEAQALVARARLNTLVSACMLLLATIALGLCGVAVMLAPLYGQAGLDHMGWWLMASPAAPALGAVACAYWLYFGKRDAPFATLQTQFLQDMAWPEETPDMPLETPDTGPVHER